MEINKHFYQAFCDQARTVKIRTVCIGIGYTVVTTSDHGIGLSYTYFDSKISCSLGQNYRNFEGQYAINLLPYIFSTNTIERSMALALINALNYAPTLTLPEDRDNQIMFDILKIGVGTHVAMVGWFEPLVGKLKARGAEVQVIDLLWQIGRPENFYPRIKDWAEVLIMTSTTLLNNTTETILARVGDQVQTVLLGPSTPLLSTAFSHLPVQLLAGTVVIARQQIIKAIRQGAGTPVIHRYGRKCYLKIS